MSTRQKWILILVLNSALVLSFGAFSFAQEMQEMGSDSGSGQGMGMGGPQGKGHKMMGMMHKESVIATSDGGVVVLSGPRLLKYDKDLNLVKEVELPKGKKPARQENANEQAEPEEAIPS